jgi:hypothetical protein
LFGGPEQTCGETFGFASWVLLPLRLRAGLLRKLPLLARLAFPALLFLAFDLARLGRFALLFLALKLARLHRLALALASFLFGRVRCWEIVRCICAARLCPAFTSGAKIWSASPNCDPAAS